MDDVEEPVPVLPEDPPDPDPPGANCAPSGVDSVVSADSVAVAVVGGGCATRGASTACCGGGVRVVVVLVSSDGCGRYSPIPPPPEPSAPP